MRFDTIVKDIKSLKIQGAQTVAKKSLEALDFVLIKSKTKNTEELKKQLLKSKEILFNTRPTEPAMRNALNYVLYDLDKTDIHILRKEIGERIDFALNHFKNGETIIPQIAANKIKNNSVVFTHCHSSTVTSILKLAKNQKKKFEVHNTETRPLFQGRKTTEELSSYGIKVKHFIDSAARMALKKADIALFGADAISTSKVYNKIGTELFCEVAERYQIPIYFCTNSWKFDPETIYGEEEKIEIRPSKEVWEKPPKNVEVMNYAFEKVDPNLITGIISELGVFSFNSFIQEVKKKYKWMFQ